MNTTLVIIGVIFMIAAFFIYSSYRKMKKTPNVPDSSKIKILNDQNFQQQTSKGLTLVDFWAAWCVPCKMMAPVLNDLAEDSRVKVNVGKINIEEYGKAASKFAVRSIPTMILFNNGKEVKRFVGFKTKDFLVKEISKFN